MLLSSYPLGRVYIATEKVLMDKLMGIDGN